jgi:uncharacterized membrane protein
MSDPGKQKIRYRSVGSGRRVLLEQIRLILILFCTGGLMLALETTVCSRIPVLLLGVEPRTVYGTPALGLLFSMAVGFLYGEREGGITGMVAGWLTDAMSTDAAVYGMMVLPLLYFLCGYLSGTVGRRRLAHNLPSFTVFATVGGGIKGLFSIGQAYLSAGAFPPPAWMIGGLLPSLVLTVIFSVPAYLIVWGEKKIVEPK